MASLFLSYDREDSVRAGHFARTLERAGHQVWWDMHVRGGAQFSKVIEEALKAADVIVVLWSANSVESAWVRDEAGVGRDSGRLVPVTIDGTDPPLGFRQFNTFDFRGWKGRGKPMELGRLLADIDAMASHRAGEPAPPPVRKLPAPSRETPRIGRSLLWAGLIFGLLIIALGLLIGRPWERHSSSAAVVAVRAGDQSQQSGEIARDLLVRLGGAPSVGVDTLQLVDENSREKPDLIFEVSSEGSSQQNAAANLILLRGSDRLLLSSQDVEAASSNPVDLKASLAASASTTLGCATEALASPHPLQPSDLKSYIGLCGRFATVYGSPEPAYALASQFEGLVRKAPQFLPAWRKLLLLESSLQMLPDDHGKPSPEELKRHIAEARRIDPRMPEADIAEAELLPTMDFDRRLELVGRAVEKAPNDALMFGARASQLMRVGRHNEALNDVEQSVVLDPLSPAVRNAFILVLAHSGRMARAVNELNEAQRLWPTAHNLLETRFRYNYRYGDFRIAERIMRAHGSGAAPAAFFAARSDPTPANIDRAISVARTSGERYGSLLGATVETLVMFGREDEAYAFLMRLPPAKFEANLASTLFRPTLKSFRQQSRFLDVTKRFGLLDYWRTSGEWPDFCADPDLPYGCKAEVAKLK